MDEEGDYLAVLQGDFTGYGVNAQAWFGREPNPLHGWQVFLFAMFLTAVGTPLYYDVKALWRRWRRRNGPTEPEQAADGEAYRRQTENEEIEANLKREREGAL